MVTKMKANEKIVLICKCYLELQGPATAREMSNFIRTSSLKVPYISSSKISSLLKGNASFKRSGKRIKYYELVK